MRVNDPDCRLHKNKLLRLKTQKNTILKKSIWFNIYTYVHTKAICGNLTKQMGTHNVNMPDGTYREIDDCWKREFKLMSIQKLTNNCLLEKCIKSNNLKKILTSICNKLLSGH